MNDETKAELMKRTREWLQSCVNAATRSGVPEEADLETFVLAHIDGEPARLAAAREEAIMEWRAGAADRDELRADCERRIAAAREEQREACALDAEERVGCASTYDEIRSVPLDATPLADELRTLWAKYDELRVKRQEWQVTAHGFEARVAELERENAAWRDTPARILYDNQRKRAEKAEAHVAEAHERLDALRARVAELEATLAKSLANRITEKAAQAALERQVAAARAECAALETEHLYTRDIECGVSIAAGRVLRAMDEATKK